MASEAKQTNINRYSWLVVFFACSLQHANIVTTFLYELRSLDEVDAGRGSADIQIHSNSSCETQPTGAECMNCWKLYIVQEYCELVRHTTAQYCTQA